MILEWILSDIIDLDRSYVVLDEDTPGFSGSSGHADSWPDSGSTSDSGSGYGDYQQFGGGSGYFGQSSGVDSDQSQYGSGSGQDDSGGTDNATLVRAILDRNIKTWVTIKRKSYSDEGTLVHV